MASSWPPSGPTVLQTAIPSYLYQEYSDDEDLQAFVDAFNGMAQQYISTFVDYNWAVYTAANIQGSLLDWIGQGLYGYSRPVLPSGHNQNLGPFNTFLFNKLTFNRRKVIGPNTYFATSDDVYKRCLTWHFYKGDGKEFSIRWLKRRVMRFLIGENGTAPPIDETPQISVTFSGPNQVNINILGGMRKVTGGALFNKTIFNKVPFNNLKSTFTAFSPFPLAPTFKAAVDAGVLELPFQHTWVVNIT